jgi:CO/xanthine dehydrogenase Mo-binding subunit
VNRSGGEIRITRFSILHDCGQIINPDGARNQIETAVPAGILNGVFDVTGIRLRSVPFTFEKVKTGLAQL